MFKVTIKLRYKAKRRARAVEAVWSLSAAYHQSGQLVGEKFVSSVRGAFILTGIAQERSSLSSANDSSAVRDSWRDLRPLLLWKPRISWEPLVEPSPTCQCSEIKEIVFDPLPHPLTESSPLWCAGCRGWIPLYRFKGGATEVLDLLSSARIWRGLHWAWMDSKEAEALGWWQIANPDSELSRLIRRRLRAFAKRHRVEAYYSLASQYCTSEGIERSICPGCGRRWANGWGQAEELICRRCRLTTGVSSDGQLPVWWEPLPRHRSR